MYDIGTIRQYEYDINNSISRFPDPSDLKTCCDKFREIIEAFRNDWTSTGAGDNIDKLITSVDSLETVIADLTASINTLKGLKVTETPITTESIIS